MLMIACITLVRITIRIGVGIRGRIEVRVRITDRECFKAWPSKRQLTRRNEPRR